MTRITRSSIINNRRGQGRVWVTPATNSEVRDRVFRDCNLLNLSGQRLNHANAFFNRAFAEGRNNFEDNLRWFRSLLGLSN